MSPTVTINHSTLGPLTGLAPFRGVTQLLGIRYATLTDRFAAPKLSVSIAENCTETGPIVPQAPGCLAKEYACIGAPVPGFSVDSEEAARCQRQHDTECLTLNMALPSSASSDSKPLPVLVFLHGGGFVWGSANLPHYNLSPMVASTMTETPFIAVSINYRENITGGLYLPDHELPGNRGLEDQYVALQWLSQYLPGFGGDPEQITVFGQSAGGCSIEYLLQRLAYEKRNGSYGGFAIKRAVILSTPAKFVVPRDEAFHRQCFDTICTALDIKPTISDKVKIQILKETTLEKLYGSVSSNVMPTPFPPLMVPWLEETSVLDVEQIIVGDAKDDFSLFIARAFHNPNFMENFITHIRKLPESASTALLSAYGLPATGRDGIETMFNELIGHSSVARIYLKQQAAGKEAWMSIFSAVNPWEGPNKGKSNHMLDVAYLFGNYDEVLGEEQRAVAAEFRNAIARFVVGQKPWKDDQNSKVFGGGKGWRTPKELTSLLDSVGGYDLMKEHLVGFLAS